MGKVTLIGLIRRVRMYGFATRCCGRRVRRWAFDQMYRSGKWDFDDKSPELITAIEDYSSKGAILILGCGTASIVRHLNQDAFQYLLGIDMSPEAISRANRHSNGKVHFEVGDVLEYQCQRNFDVILFPESLYYIKATEQEGLLKRLSRHLNPEGCIMVTVVNPKGYGDIIQMVRTSFKVLREACFNGEDRFLLAFR